MTIIEESIVIRTAQDRARSAARAVAEALYSRAFTADAAAPDVVEDLRQAAVLAPEFHPFAEGIPALVGLLEDGRELVRRLAFAEAKRIWGNVPSGAKKTSVDTLEASFGRPDGWDNQGEPFWALACQGGTLFI